MSKDKVLYKFADGDEIYLYSIGELAKRLGRTSLTVRTWEIAGKIPMTCFSNSRGERLYSEAMMKIIVKAAEEEKITIGSSFQRTKFVQKCHDGFAKLLQKYNEKNSGRVGEDKFKRVKGKAF